MYCSKTHEIEGLKLCRMTPATYGIDYLCWTDCDDQGLHVGCISTPVCLSLKCSCSASSWDQAGNFMQLCTSFVLQAQAVGCWQHKMACKCDGASTCMHELDSRAWQAASS